VRRCRQSQAIEAWIKEEKRELAFGKNSKQSATTAVMLRLLPAAAAAAAAARLLDSPAA